MKIVRLPASNHTGTIVLFTWPTPSVSETRGVIAVLINICLVWFYYWSTCARLRIPIMLLENLEIEAIFASCVKNKFLVFKHRIHCPFKIRDNRFWHDQSTMPVGMDQITAMSYHIKKLTGLSKFFIWPFLRNTCTSTDLKRCINF